MVATPTGWQAAPTTTRRSTSRAPVFPSHHHRGRPPRTCCTASPASPQLTRTSVTLTDTISSGGSTATAATGNINFMANGNVIGTVPGQQRRRHLHDNDLAEPDQPADGDLLGGLQLCRQHFGGGAVHDPAAAVGHAEPAHHSRAVLADPDPDVGHLPTQAQVRTGATTSTCNCGFRTGPRVPRSHRQLSGQRRELVPTDI